MLRPERNNSMRAPVTPMYVCRFISKHKILDSISSRFHCLYFESSPPPSSFLGAHCFSILTVFHSSFHCMPIEVCGEH